MAMLTIGPVTCSHKPINKTNRISQLHSLHPDRRQLISLAVPILFLPWRGCSEGGFYDTGLGGTPGKDCQKVYQPAAAAEQRFKERQSSKTEQPSTPARPQLSPKTSTTIPSPSDREQLLVEQQTYDRLAIDAEKAERTRKFVEDMWQSLE